MKRSEYRYFNLSSSKDKDKQLLLKHIKSLWTYLTQRITRDDTKKSKAPQHTLHKYRISVTNQLSLELDKLIKSIPLGLLGKIVLKWKNQLEAYGNIEYNIHTS